MSALDAPRIDALARALDLSSRQLLVAALQLASADAADGTNEDERRRQAIARVRAAPQAAAAVSALLLTPVSSFAQDDIDRALATLWHAPVRAEG